MYTLFRIRLIIAVWICTQKCIRILLILFSGHVYHGFLPETSGTIYIVGAIILVESQACNPVVYCIAKEIMYCPGFKLSVSKIVPKLWKFM